MAVGIRCSNHSLLTDGPNEPRMHGCHSLLSCLSKRNAVMNDYDPTRLRETVSARPVSNTTSGTPRWLMAAVLMAAVIGLSACGTSSVTTTSPSATAAGNGSSGGLGSGGGSNARSGPAAGGASGTV